MNPVPRILVIDDTPAIHDDFRKIFTPTPVTQPHARIDNLAAAIFETSGPATSKPEVSLDFAFQGQEGLELVREAVAERNPYALAFVDMRMPPGWDGLETIPRLWEADPRLQIIICTAYSDHGWPAISTRLGRSDNLIILKKPFDEIEVLQLAQALTEKWRLTAAAALKREELEAMVARRTAELQRATAVAERANRAKGVFLATINHELRTPLNGLLGTISLLLGSRLDEEQRELVQTLDLSTGLLNTLINDLLDISKIDSTRLDLQPVPFLLQDTLDSVVRLLSHKAAEKQLTFTVDRAPSLPAPLIGDPLRLRQILFNLVGNALKFTETGSVALNIQLLDLKPASARLRFDVIDTGIGISAENQARLFQSFTQIDDTDTRRYEGSGLGLSITEGIVKLMQGTISVQSQPNRGSAFSVTLEFPLVPEAAPPKPPEKEPVSPAKIPPPHILVAEDNLVNQKVLQQHLRRHGLVTDIVGNGREAIVAISKKHYDLVFMDCHMPELDGLSTAKLIRAHEATEKLGRIPIVAISAGLFEEDRNRCLAAGMDDYLSKPFNPQTVLAVLQRHLPAGSIQSR